jgi:hypothetical protein
VVFNNIEKFLLPNLLSIAGGGSISQNENLEEIDLDSLEEIGSNFAINDNNLLSVINLNNFYKGRRYDGYHVGGLTINNNSNLKTINLGTGLDLETKIQIFNNEKLEEINVNNITNVVSGEINIQNNETLKSVSFNSLKSSNDVKDKKYWSEPYISIGSNKLLEEINAPSLEDFYKITIASNESLSEVIFPELTTVYKNLSVQSNVSLSKVHMPKLETTGDKVYSSNSFYLYNNPLLSTIDFTSLHKVYTSLSISSNNQLDLNDFPCNLFVLVNDGLDCTFGDIYVSNNLDDTYCFQDPSLIPPIDIQTVAAFNINSDQAQTATNITSYTKMKSRGVVWSTSANPTIDDVNDFSSENGSLNGSYDSYMYNLQPNTTYYFRAYGEDCNGVFYGNELEFTTLP